MAFEPGVVRQASMRLLRRKEERMGRRERLEQDLYQREPELRRLDGEIRGTMVELAGLLASGKPLEAEGAEIAAVREKNLALKRGGRSCCGRWGVNRPSWRTSRPVPCAGTLAGRGAGCAGA